MRPEQFASKEYITDKTAINVISDLGDEYLEKHFRLITGNKIFSFCGCSLY